MVFNHTILVEIDVIWMISILWVIFCTFNLCHFEVFSSMCFSKCFSYHLLKSFPVLLKWVITLMNTLFCRVVAVSTLNCSEFCSFSQSASKILSLCFVKIFPPSLFVSKHKVGRSEFSIFCDIYGSIARWLLKVAIN